MKIYLVGGAVRDQLLGFPVKERDWVVVGASVNEMLEAGFRQVGKDFPVFLHPVTHEEYALARTERKIGRGYTGFDFNADAGITLEDDLLRRDLTINAMAQTAEGDIIDPYGGQADIAQKILRHVSSAFSEDPVRILRIARFSARFAFTIAPKTMELMQLMVQQGEIDALVAERVWKELERALREPWPEKFFAVLAACGALNILFPQIKLDNNGLTALVRAANYSINAKVRLAVLLHTLTLNEVIDLCKHYRIPTDYRDLAVLLVKHLPCYQQAKQLNENQLLDLLLATDALRRPARFKDFLAASAACSEFSHSDWLLACYETATTVSIKELTAHYTGQQLAEKIREKRCTAIKKLLYN